MNHQHIFKQGNPERPLLLLLHGTGGTEHDLFFLGEAIDPEASLLGVRGNVTESGMNRYFRRLAEGVFDENDLGYRTKELIAFLDDASKEYGFDRNNIVVIGYSNGANIAGSMIYSFNDAVKGAILHHPMVPFRNRQLPDLHSLPVFIGAGTNDPLCAPEESTELKATLEGAGSDVSIYWGNAGHSLTNEEVVAAKAWYNKHF
jgi:phospholipase/carboxylesterase